MNKRIDQPGVTTVDAALQDRERKPIWQRLAEMGETLSPEDQAKLPSDLAEEHDHYLYGWPKKQA